MSAESPIESSSPLLNPFFNIIGEEFLRQNMTGTTTSMNSRRGGTLTQSSSSNTDSEILEVQRQSFELLQDYPNARSVTMAHPINGIPCTFHRPIPGNVRFVNPDPESKQGESKVNPPAGRGTPQEPSTHSIRTLLGMNATPQDNTQLFNNLLDIFPRQNSSLGSPMDSTRRDLFSNGRHNYATYMPTAQVMNGSMIRNINWDDASNNIYQSLTVLPNRGYLPFNPRILRRRHPDNLDDDDLLQQSLFNYQPPNDPIDPIIRARLIENTVSRKPENALSCRICLSEYEVGERQLFLPCCHGFHVECIDKWFETSHRCPECRTQVNC